MIDNAINFPFVKFTLNTMNSVLFVTLAIFKPKLQQPPSYLYMLHETAETMSNC